jgi:hypothetical protein
MSNTTFCICFFGINRCLSKTIGSIRGKIYDPILEAGHSMHVYAAFMDPKGPITNPRSSEVNLQIEPENIELLGEGKIQVIDQPLFDETFDYAPFFEAPDPWDDGYISIKNMCRSYESLKQVTQMWLEDSLPQDTLFVYLRPDQIYLDKLPIKQILKAHDQFGPHLALTPFWALWGGLNDRMAVMGRSAAEIYGLRQKRMYEYIQNSKTGLHSEEYLKWSLKDIPNIVNQPPLLIRANRVRADYRIRKEYFLNESGKRLTLKLEFILLLTKAICNYSGAQDCGSSG